MSRRTTLTLEDDVVSRLAEESRRTGRPLKAVVNEAIRRGLDAGGPSRERIEVTPREMGLRPGMEFDDVHGLLDRLEGPEHR